MTEELQRKAIPALLCAIAVISMTATGFFLFDSRDQLVSAPTIEDDNSFVAYAAEEESEPLEEFSEEFFTAEEGWEILEPVIAAEKESIAEENIPSPASNRSEGNATLVVVTNFTRAQVTVNGEPYPAYSDDGNEGMRLHSGQRHEVLVTFDGKEKLYRIELLPGERRLLMVELTGLRAREAPAERRERRPQRREREEEQEEASDEQGRITVYSRPRGSILVGDRDMNQKTPGTVDVDAGRHEVQVRYDDGEISETKVVRVREGSRIKLFFRQDD